MNCRYDREFEDYLTPDGKPCLTDDYGDPTRHCTARRTCSQHIGHGEITCARCIGRARAHLRRIVERAALMPVAALADGVDSETANLAGPAADVVAWSWRKIAAKQGRAWHQSLIEEDDERHPHTVLTRWQMMLSEEYGHDLPDKLTIATASAYLEKQLHVVAQDENQDFPLLARELRKCGQHLDAALRNSHASERGAPCPACVEQDGKGPRLIRKYGHWCEAETCTKIHHADDTGDWWQCPVHHGHQWDEATYRLWVADVYTEEQARVAVIG